MSRRRRDEISKQRETHLVQARVLVTVEPELGELEVGLGAEALREDE